MWYFVIVAQADEDSLLAMSLCSVIFVVVLGFMVYILNYHSLPSSNIIPLHDIYKSYNRPFHFSLPGLYAFIDRHIVYSIHLHYVTSHMHHCYCFC